MNTNTNANAKTNATMKASAIVNKYNDIIIDTKVYCNLQHSTKDTKARYLVQLSNVAREERNKAIKRVLAKGEKRALANVDEQKALANSPIGQLRHSVVSTIECKANKDIDEYTKQVTSKDKNGKRHVNVKAFEYKYNCKLVTNRYRHTHCIASNDVESCQLYACLFVMTRNVSNNIKEDVIQECILSLLTTPYDKNVTWQKVANQVIKKYKIKARQNAKYMISKEYNENIKSDANDNTKVEKQITTSEFVNYTYSKAQWNEQKQMLQSYNETAKAIQERKKEVHEQRSIFGGANNNNEYRKIRKIIKANFKGQKCEKLLKVLTYLNKGNTIQEIEKKTSINHSTITKYIVIIGDIMQSEKIDISKLVKYYK